MIVSHKHKLISISVPKTGSTSVHHALLSCLDIRFRTKNQVAHIYHLAAEDIERIMGPKKFQSYFSFGTVRNPYDRLVSLYHDFHDQRGAIRADNFRDFVLDEFEKRWKENIHFRPQVFFLCKRGDIMVSRVFRFEDGLDNELAALGRHFGFDPANLGHARKSDRKHWREYYTEQRLFDIVNDTYSVDFDRFGYEKLDAGKEGQPS